MSPAPQKNSLPFPASHPPRPTAPCPFYWLNRILKNLGTFLLNSKLRIFCLKKCGHRIFVDKYHFCIYDPKNKHFIKTYNFGPKHHSIIVKGKITSYLVYFHNQEHNCQSKISLSNFLSDKIPISVLFYSTLPCPASHIFALAHLRPTREMCPVHA